jgi:hypothetical protein
MHQDSRQTPYHFGRRSNVLPLQREQRKLDEVGGSTPNPVPSGQVSRRLLFAGLIGAVTGVVIKRAFAASPEPKGVLQTDFDPIFRRQAPSVPVTYLRVLAKHESDFNPSQATGCCWGLLQVDRGDTLDDFNRREGTSFDQEDLLNATVNVRIGGDLLRRIATRFAKLHPVAFPNGVEWDSSRFAGLVTQAWNAGHSEAAGAGLVIGILEDEGRTASEITPASVHAAAKRIPKATKNLRNVGKLGFVNRVVRDYDIERGVRTGSV